MTKLSDFRVDEPRPSAVGSLDSSRPSAEPAPIAYSYRGAILAVDQSLANTGWAMIEQGIVTWTGNIKIDPMDKGHEDTLQRATKLHAEFQYLLSQFDPDVIVHETPPVGGARMMRPESSLTAALALRIAARPENLRVVMVGAQRAKKRWTGNGNAKKPEVREALKRAMPELQTKKPMNQAIIDAIAIGMVVAEEGIENE